MAELKKPEKNVIYTFFFLKNGRNTTTRLIFDHEQSDGRYFFFNYDHGTTTTMTKARFDYIFHKNQNKDFPPKPIETQNAEKPGTPPKLKQVRPDQIVKTQFEKEIEEEAKKDEDEAEMKLKFLEDLSFAEKVLLDKKLTFNLFNALKEARDFADGKQILHPLTILEEINTAFRLAK